MSTQVEIEASVSTECSCEDYNEDTAKYLPSDECFGCHEDSKYYAEAVLLEWRSRTFPERERVKIVGTNMLWTRVSGWMTADFDRVIESLGLERADYRLVFKLKGNDLTVMRYSHDEPTGATFYLELVEDDEADDE